MVEIDISDIEANAFAALLSDAKLPAEMGWILTNLKIKLVIERN